MSRSALIAFCGLLLSVSAFSCDITLPAFWSMQQDLDTPIEWVQAVVPIFLMAQALGQMVFGPVSDRFGRRPVIVGGLVLYLAGTLVALLGRALARSTPGARRKASAAPAALPWGVQSCAT